MQQVLQKGGRTGWVLNPDGTMQHWWHALLGITISSLTHQSVLQHKRMERDFDVVKQVYGLPVFSGGKMCTTW